MLISVCAPTHVTTTVSACFASSDPQRTRHALLVLVHALVASKVDHCNSVLAGTFRNLIRRLQSVMNAAARPVFPAKRSDHITPLLRELHWLKVPERIQFRLGVLTYRCLHNTAPSYLAESLQPAADVEARRRLRSADSRTLVVPATRCLTLSDRAFPVSSARSGTPCRLASELHRYSLRFGRSLNMHFFSDHFLMADSSLRPVFVQCPCNSCNCDTSLFYPLYR